MFTLKLQIVKARNLLALDSGGAFVRVGLGGTSDPYAKVYVNSHPKKFEKTQTVKKTVNPTWEKDVVFTEVTYGDNLVVEVYDRESIGSDRLLGTAEVEMTVLENNLLQGKNATWLKLTSKKSNNAGEVFIEYAFDPPPASRTATAVRASVAPSGSGGGLSQAGPGSAPRTSVAATPTDLPASMSPRAAAEKRKSQEVSRDREQLVFSVKISNCSARDLLAKDVGGTSDPYIKFDLDGNMFKTNTIPRTLHPTWTGFVKEVKLELKPPNLYDLDIPPQWTMREVMQQELSNRKLTVAVYDSDKVNKDDLIGTATVDLLTLVTGARRYCLSLYDGSTPAGRVMFDIEVRQEQGVGPFVQMARGLYQDGVVIQGEVRPALQLVGFSDLAKQHGAVEQIVQMLVNHRHNDGLVLEGLRALVFMRARVEGRSNYKLLLELLRDALGRGAVEPAQRVLEVLGASVAAADQANDLVHANLLPLLETVVLPPKPQPESAPSPFGTLLVPVGAVLGAVAANTTEYGTFAKHNGVRLVVTALGMGLSPTRMFAALANILSSGECLQQFRQEKGEAAAVAALARATGAKEVVQAACAALDRAARMQPPLPLGYDGFVGTLIGAMHQYVNDAAVLRGLFGLFETLLSRKLVPGSEGPLRKDYGSALVLALNEFSKNIELVEECLNHLAFLLPTDDVQLLLKAVLAPLRTMSDDIDTRHYRIKELKAKKSPTKEQKKDLEREAALHKAAKATFKRVVAPAARMLAGLLQMPGDAATHYRTLLGEELSQADITIAKFVVSALDLSDAPLQRGQFHLCLAILALIKVPNVRRAAFGTLNSLLALALSTGFASLNPTDVVNVLQALLGALCEKDPAPGVFETALLCFSSLAQHPAAGPVIRASPVSDALVTNAKSYLASEPIKFGVLGEIMKALLFVLVDDQACQRFSGQDQNWQLLFAILSHSMNNDAASLEHTTGVLKLLLRLPANKARMLSEPAKLYVVLTALKGREHNANHVVHVADVLNELLDDERSKYLLVEAQAIELATGLLAKHSSNDQVLARLIRFLGKFSFDPAAAPLSTV